MENVLVLSNRWEKYYWYGTFEERSGSVVVLKNAAQLRGDPLSASRVAVDWTLASVVKPESVVEQVVVLDAYAVLTVSKEVAAEMAKLMAEAAAELATRHATRSRASGAARQL